MALVEGPEMPDGTNGYYFHPSDWYMPFLLSIASLGYQFTISYACKFEKKASNIAIIFQSQTFFSFVFDRVIFGNAILLVNVIGALLVAGCAALIVISKEQLQAIKQDPVEVEKEVLGLDKKDSKSEKEIMLKEKMLK